MDMKIAPAKHIYDKKIYIISASLSIIFCDFRSNNLIIFVKKTKKNLRKQIKKASYKRGLLS